MRFLQKQGSCCCRVRTDTSSETERCFYYGIEGDFSSFQRPILQLHSLLPEPTIFASNTYQLSITALAAASHRSDRFIGMHWFNPPNHLWC
ncbi:3-hydroxyacyl-CoA dehydrogenase NAD-binding domain-containing protein [Carboxydocella sp. JDF658]|uniref:3-hydroxyacyl-CoA dehydrogenase NAD-binding domain-containing protein n=1 Tax=Carboxydocella sp. JDF658 TaxID=1926600 RepID=UPI0009AC496F|nr:3-hydroxyacyl-CoA dehydrogenase NAD-binding domain-containing protein [Carboxydocella sp. JDF658]